MTRAELLKIAKPILFNTEMVRAILDGKKTVTRRAVKPSKEWNFIDRSFLDGELDEFTIASHDETEFVKSANPKYKVGDILYVRETFAKGRIDYGENSDGTPEPYISQCTDDVGYVPKEYAMRHDIGVDDVIWKPSIHMPKSAARIFLKVTDVRCERLQDITEEQALKEGVRSECSKCIYYKTSECEECANQHESYYDFVNTWDSTIKKQDIGKYNWEANPWVWVYEFEKLEVENG